MLGHALILVLSMLLAACEETPEAYAQRIDIESEPNSGAVGRGGAVAVSVNLTNTGGREVRSVTVGVECRFGRSGSVSGTVVSGPLPPRGRASASGPIGTVRLVNLSPDLQMTPYGMCTYRVTRVELGAE